MKKNKRADFLINEALHTFMERRKVYGDSYIMHAKVMAAMFPQGISLKTEVDMARWSVFNLIVGFTLLFWKSLTKQKMEK